MRTSVLALLVAAGTALAAPAGQASNDIPVAVAAKTCSAGYTHAIIGGAQKCLRRGEYCASRYKRTYLRYGYRCTGGRLH